jgi:simple sugar transport system ATP-binding protein
MMVGRKVLLRVDKAPARPGPVVLNVEDLRVMRHGVERLKGVSLQVRAGEILGIAGVAGNGQTELLEVLGGMIPAQGGTVTLHNEPVDITGKHSNGQSRRARGIGHVPEDRQDEGLIMPFEAWENVAFGYHHDAKYNSGLFMDNGAIKDDCEDKMARYDVRPPNPRLPARNFSGGNQQKIVVAREMDRAPDLLLVGQPTRGVDIGAIEFIHKEILRLRDEGKAILLVSVELDEIMGLSDRIAVMFDGKIMGERLPGETDENELGLLMAGVTEGAA